MTALGWRDWGHGVCRAFCVFIFWQGIRKLAGKTGK